MFVIIISGNFRRNKVFQPRFLTSGRRISLIYISIYIRVDIYIRVSSSEVKYISILDTRHVPASCLVLFGDEWGESAARSGESGRPHQRDGVPGWAAQVSDQAISWSKCCSSWLPWWSCADACIQQAKGRLAMPHIACMYVTLYVYVLCMYYVCTMYVTHTYYLLTTCTKQVYSY